MSERWADFYPRFPKLFAEILGPVSDEPLSCFGIECEFGWRVILERLCEKLEPLTTPGHGFIQVKQKFGELRIYGAQENEEAQALVEAAVVESRKTCERCAGPTPCACRIVKRR